MVEKMSIIKINCPQCKQEVVLEKSQINKAQGRVDCPHCAHVFHLVKKASLKKIKRLIQPFPKPTQLTMI